MLAKQIVVSKNEILNKYNNLNEKVKSIIEKLYEIDKYQKEYKLTNEINIKKFIIDSNFLENIRNNNELKKYKEKTGVYIFLKENIPVYIGFSGQVNKKQSLYERIVDKHFSTNDDLVKSIKKIERLLNPNGLIKDNRKSLILEYTSSLVVIDCSDKTDINVKFAQDLEVILIALFNSKYNL